MGPWSPAWLRRHDHSSRADHLVRGAIAPLHDVEHDARVDSLLLARGERLVHVGVELLALGVDRLDARALEHSLEVDEHETHALGEAVALGRCARERPLEVVDHREQLADQAGPSTAARGGDVLRRALAVVLEVGLRPLGEVEVLVALALCGGQRVLLACGLLGLGLGLRMLLTGALVGRAVLDLGLGRLGRLGGRLVVGRLGTVGPLGVLVLLAELITDGVLLWAGAGHAPPPSPSTPSASTPSSSPPAVEPPSAPPSVVPPFWACACCAAA